MPRSRTIGTVVVAAALGIGFVATRDGDERPQPTAPIATADTVPTGSTLTPRTHAAESAEAAVRGFLDAERAGDYATSFDFLSDADRAAFGSAAGWVADHADYVPPVEGYEVASVDGDAVVTDVDYTPSLDAVVGLVPGRARVTWTAVPGEAWGVALGATLVEAQHPDEDAAPGAVERWAESRQACGEPTGEWSGDLLGAPALADALCDTDVAPAGGAATLLGPAEGAPFSAAFGDEVSVWARVVPVDRPVPLRAVVAPLGDDWVVVGVLGAGPGAGL